MVEGVIGFVIGFYIGMTLMAALSIARSRDD